MKKLLCLLLMLVFLPCLAFSEDAAVQNVVVYDWEEMPEALETDLQIHFIRVGASDCMLLSCGGETMMVDTGNDNEAKRALAYLEKEGLTHLDYIFITHPHNDHIGGAGSILSALDVDTVLFAGGYEDFSSRRWDALHAQTDELQIETRTVFCGDTMTLGGASLTFYNYDNPKETVNNRSMMVLVTLGNRSALLTADVENAGQDAIAEQFGEHLKADIIKLAHHGLAPLRPKLREAVQPEVAVCSNNSGDSKDTIKNVRYHGIECFITPKGSITVQTDGETWALCQWPREP